MKPFAKIATVLFGAVALAHLYRLVSHFEVTIAGNTVPQWVSIAGVIIAGAISIGLMKESRK